MRELPLSPPEPIEDADILETIPADDEDDGAGEDLSEEEESSTGLETAGAEVDDEEVLEAGNGAGLSGNGVSLGEVREIFHRYDRDGSGTIDAAELARLLEAMGQPLSEEELEVALDVVDANRSGKVSWSEFQTWWQAR